VSKEDQNNSSTEEFIDRINKQKGRTSTRIITNSNHLSKNQENSWNENGYILIPRFISEDKCEETNQAVIDIVRSMVGRTEEFNHAYIDQGHIGIREMKPAEKVENTE
ncbi:uncharacterized protein METZ01_LOCUS194422, partial [marine metagenome]